jgi:hypothetical protein
MKVYLGSMRCLMGQGFNPKVDEEIVVKAYKWNDDFVAAIVNLPAQNKPFPYAMKMTAPYGEGGLAADPAVNSLGCPPVHLLSVDGRTGRSPSALK